MYLRYADVFVVLITGNINDAKHIKSIISDIITKKCGLTLHDKTLITALKEGLMFLGVKISFKDSKDQPQPFQKQNETKNRITLR